MEDSMIGIGQMMGTWSLGHWLLFALGVALVLYPIGRILDRLGISPFWSVLALIPVVNLAALWLLAFSAWPRDGGQTR
jgi:hypothetical protein